MKRHGKAVGLERGLTFIDSKVLIFAEQKQRRRAWGAGGSLLSIPWAQISSVSARCHDSQVTHRPPPPRQTAGTSTEEVLCLKNQQLVAFRAVRSRVRGGITHSVGSL